MQGIISLEEHAIKFICDVKLGEVDGAGSWVSVAEQPEDSREGSPELHHLMGQVQNGLVIDPKPAVVDNHTWAAVVLDFDGHRRKVKVLFQGLDLLQGEHQPESGLNEVCILIMEEVPAQVGRWVWALLSTAGEMFSCPWWIVHVDCSTMIVECLKVGACLVRNVADVVSQVGWASHLVHELFPGSSICQAS